MPKVFALRPDSKTRQVSPATLQLKPKYLHSLRPQQSISNFGRGKHPRRVVIDTRRFHFAPPKSPTPLLRHRLSERVAGEVAGITMRPLLHPRRARIKATAGRRVCRAQIKGQRRRKILA